MNRKGSPMRVCKFRENDFHTRIALMARGNYLELNDRARAYLHIPLRRAEVRKQLAMVASRNGARKQKSNPHMGLRVTKH